MAIIPYNNSSNDFNRISQTPPQDLPPKDISMLPPDMLIQICHHLGIQEIGRLASTQQKFYFLASDSVISNPFWKSLFYNDYHYFNNASDEIKKIADKISFYKFYKCLTQVIHNTKNWRSLPEQNEYNSKMKRFFKTDEELLKLITENQSIRNQIINKIKRIREKSIVYYSNISCIKVVGKKFLISCSQKNGTITIWDLQSSDKQKIIKLKTGQESIKNIKIINSDTLVFSSPDGINILPHFKTVEKELLLKNRKLLRSTANCFDNIKCMKIIDSKKEGKTLIISGSSHAFYDAIEIWNPETQNTFQINLNQN